MEVHGVGPVPGGLFPASGGITPEPGASLLGDHVRAKLEALKGMAIDLIGDVLSDAHLGEVVEKLGLPAEPTRLLAARALVAEQGRLDPGLLKEVERGLSKLERPAPADAAAIAFLVVRRLPVTPETAQMVLGRHDAPQTSGERLKLLVEKVSLQWGPEDESGLAAPEPEPSRVPRLAEGLERLFAGMPPERRAALTQAVTQLLSAFAPAEPQGEAPAPHAQPPAQALPLAPGAEPQPASPQQPPLHEAIVQAYRALPAPLKPAFEAALDELLSTFAPDADAAEAPVSARPEAPSAAAPSHAAPAHPSPKAEALAQLQALALPEGGRAEVEGALKRLVAALVPPEADLARLSDEAAPEEAPAQPLVSPERLASVLERVVDRHPADLDARAMRDEIRFGQLRTAGNEGLALTIPLWWSGGSGEIRVHERQGGGESGSGGQSEATRVVIALDTPHLSGVRIDLLLHQRQVNCQVALQDPAAAAFLEPRLQELRDAIEGIGIKVGMLGLRKEAPRRKAPVPAPASQAAPSPGVDFYG